MESCYNAVQVGGIVTSMIMSCCVSCIIYKDSYAVRRICGHCILKFAFHFALSSALPDLKEFLPATSESGYYCSNTFILILEAIHFCLPLVITLVITCFCQNLP